MTTNKARRIIIAAVIIAVAITSFKLYRQHQQPKPADSISYRCFTNGQYWGYDILVGKKILIHQSIDPAAKGRIGFDSKQAAEVDARIVIGKIKLGETPVFNDH
jgi:hypothetical protein